MLKGVFCLMICASLAFPAAADDTLEDGRFSGSGGFITNPTGLFLRHDYSLATTLLPTILGEGFWGDVEVGVYHLYQVFSNEFGAQLAWQTEPALLRLSLDMGFEPGAFIEVDQTQSGVIYDTDSPRILSSTLFGFTHAARCFFVTETLLNTTRFKRSLYNERYS